MDNIDDYRKYKETRDDGFCTDIECINNIVALVINLCRHGNLTFISVETEGHGDWFSLLANVDNVEYHVKYSYKTYDVKIHEVSGRYIRVKITVDGKSETVTYMYPDKYEMNYLARLLRERKDDMIVRKLEKYTPFQTIHNYTKPENTNNIINK